MTNPTPDPIGPKRSLPGLGRGFWFILLLLALVFVGWASGYVPLFHNRPIYISGTVMDEKARPLKGVTLKVTKNTFVLTSASHNMVKRNKRTINGSFRIFCYSCSNLNLWFFKKGYYDETIEVRGGRSDFFEVTLRRNVAIVLEQTGQLPNLEKYRGALRFSAEGIETVVPIHSGFGTKGITLDRLTQELDGPPGSKPSEFLYLSLEAGVDAEGELVTKWKQPQGDQLDGSKRSSSAAEYPVDVVLDLLKARGGIIIHEPPKGLVAEKGYAGVSRSMRIAPAATYRPRVRLDADRRRGSYYFFCLIKGRYGKGRITAPRLRRWRNRRVVEAYVEVRLNPDGSRNVASIH